MSEFQYYEFRAIDRSLAQREMRKLRAISTRAEITPTSFVNTYEWGDLKGDPNRFMEKYFDAFVYVANWGTREFMLRIPEKALDRRTIAAYCRGDNLDARWVNHFLILHFFCEHENGDDWDDGDGWMSSLITLRADLMRGDMRSLYLGWLLCAQDEAFDEEELEPPVPPGLTDQAVRRLTACARRVSDAGDTTGCSTLTSRRSSTRFHMSCYSRHCGHIPTAAGCCSMLNAG